MAKKPSYLMAAFLVPANLFALAAAALSSAMVGDPTPAFVALGMEAVYLGTLPLSSRFRRSVRAGSRGADPESVSEAMLEELAPSQREHYFALRELRDRILTNYRKLPGGGILVASSESRLDALLTNFLRLISTLNSYRKYLSAPDRSAVEREVKDLQEEIAAEGNARLREVKQKRVQILQKRLDRFKQAEDSRELVSHQLASIEDLLRLTHEQSIAIRDPESLSLQLDALSAEAAATEETVREMERFMDFGDELRSGAPPERDRVRS